MTLGTGTAFGVIVVVGVLLVWLATWRHSR
jgi:hypothetical protein